MHDRRLSYPLPSFRATGTTHVKQRPYPHPMRSSIETCAGIWRSRQKLATRSNVVG